MGSSSKVIVWALGTAASSMLDAAGVLDEGDAARVGGLGVALVAEGAGGGEAGRSQAPKEATPRSNVADRKSLISNLSFD
jgi:hypothetical protein